MNDRAVWWEAEAVPEVPDVPDGSSTAWAVVVLDEPSGQVRGVVGPFRSPDYARAYADEGGFCHRLIVPALCLTLPAEAGGASMAVL